MRWNDTLLKITYAFHQSEPWPAEFRTSKNTVRCLTNRNRRRQTGVVFDDWYRFIWKDKDDRCSALIYVRFLALLWLHGPSSPSDAVLANISILSTYIRSLVFDKYSRYNKLTPLMRWHGHCCSRRCQKAGSLPHALPATIPGHHLAGPHTAHLSRGPWTTSPLRQSWRQQDWRHYKISCPSGGRHCLVMSSDSIQMFLHPSTMDADGPYHW